MATIELIKEIDKEVNNTTSWPRKIVWLIDIALGYCQDDEVKAFLLLARSRQNKLERPEE